MPKNFYRSCAVSGIPPFVPLEVVVSLAECFGEVEAACSLADVVEHSPNPRGGANRVFAAADPTKADTMSDLALSVCGVRLAHGGWDAAIPPGVSNHLSVGYVTFANVHDAEDFNDWVIRGEPNTIGGVLADPPREFRPTRKCAAEFFVQSNHQKCLPPKPTSLVLLTSRIDESAIRSCFSRFGKIAEVSVDAHVGDTIITFDCADSCVEAFCAWYGASWAVDGGRLCSYLYYRSKLLPSLRQRVTGEIRAYEGDDSSSSDIASSSSSTCSSTESELQELSATPTSVRNGESMSPSLRSSSSFGGVRSVPRRFRGIPMKVPPHHFVSMLEEGNNGIVCLFQHSQRQRRRNARRDSFVAIKFVLPDDPNIALELRALQVVQRTPYAPRLLRIDRSQFASISMELLGPDLMHFSNHMLLTDGMVLLLARATLSAIWGIHSCGVVHKSVKPENFCFDAIQASNDIRVKVIDYGRSECVGHNGEELSDRREPPYSGWWYSVRGLVGLEQRQVDDLISLMHCWGYLCCGKSYCRHRRSFAKRVPRIHREINEGIIDGFLAVPLAHFRKFKKRRPTENEIFARIPPEEHPEGLPQWWHKCYEYVSYAASRTVSLVCSNDVYSQLHRILDESLRTISPDSCESQCHAIQGAVMEMVEQRLSKALGSVRRRKRRRGAPDEIEGSACG